MRKALFKTKEASKEAWTKLCATQGQGMCICCWSPAEEKVPAVSQMDPLLCWDSKSATAIAEPGSSCLAAAARIKVWAFPRRISLSGGQGKRVA